MAKKPFNNEGYIYVLTNPAMGGIVKIGKTSRELNDRIRELNSASGVPLPFTLEGYVISKNLKKTEKEIHHQLANKRINRKREFFRVSAADALKVARKVAQREGSSFKAILDVKSAISAVICILSLGSWMSLLHIGIAIGWVIILSSLTLINRPTFIRSLFSVPSKIGYLAEMIVIFAGVFPILISKDTTKIQSTILYKIKAIYLMYF